MNPVLCFFSPRKHSSWKKKAMEGRALIGILLTVVSFFVLTGVAYTMHNTYNVDQEIALTRASLFAAEKLKLAFEGHTFYRPNFYLRSHSLEIPEHGYSSSKEDVMRNLAERIADCWWEFGSGEIPESVFDKVLMKSKDKCFVCFIANVKQLDTPFYFTDLLSYLTSHPYKARNQEKEICTNTDNDPPDCLPPSAPECEVKGGNCRDHERGCQGGEVPYQDWQCSAGKQCCVNQKQMVTYLDYIQSNNGLIYFPQEMYNGEKKEVRQGMAYAIIFRDKTKSVGTSFGHLVALSAAGALAGTVVPGVGNLIGAIGGAAAGALVWSVEALYNTFIPHYYPPGVMFLPYDPSGESYAECEMVEES